LRQIIRREVKPVYIRAWKVIILEKKLLEYDHNVTVAGTC